MFELFWTRLYSDGGAKESELINIRMSQPRANQPRAATISNNQHFVLPKVATFAT